MVDQQEHDTTRRALSATIVRDGRNEEDSKTRDGSNSRDQETFEGTRKQERTVGTGLLDARFLISHAIVML